MLTFNASQGFGSDKHRAVYRTLVHLGWVSFIDLLWPLFRLLGSTVNGIKTKVKQQL